MVREKGKKKLKKKKQVKQKARTVNIGKLHNENKKLDIVPEVVENIEEKVKEVSDEEVKKLEEIIEKKEIPSGLKKIVTNKPLFFIFIAFLSLLIFITTYLFREVLLPKAEIISHEKISNNIYLLNNLTPTVYFETTVKTYPRTDDYSSKSVLIYDLNANQVIFSKNSNTKILIASITKIISTKVLLDSVDHDKKTTIDEKTEKIEGSALMLKKGQTFSNIDLIKSAVIASSNQAVNILDNPDKTVEKMNEFSEALGNKKTQFSNPAGFDDLGRNYSTAEEIIPFAKIFFADPTLRSFASSAKDEITELTENKGIKITNTNDLLRLETKHVIAGKTGTTEGAGQNLLLLIEKNDRQYLVILMNGADRYVDAYKVLARL